MTAGEPSDESSRQPPRGWWVAAGVLALLLVVGLVVLWVQAPALYGQGDAAKAAAATTRGGILTVAAVLITATAAGAGLYMTARTIRINQQALAETERANREADQRDRYAKAIEQLGSSKLDVRLGGIYGLEHIAETSERDQRTVVEVLRTFVSEHSRSRPGRGHRRPSHSTERIATDVQAAIDVLLRLPGHPGLPKVQLDHAHLSHARLEQANLTGARLMGANLIAAGLSEANLSGAGLSGNLAGAHLSGAWLGKAGLAGAKNLTQRQLDSARGDDLTVLPDGLQRPAHWSAGSAAPPTADP